MVKEEVEKLKNMRWLRLRKTKWRMPCENHAFAAKEKTNRRRRERGEVKKKVIILYYFIFLVLFHFSCTIFSIKLTTYTASATSVSCSPITSCAALSIVLHASPHSPCCSIFFTESLPPVKDFVR